MSGVNNGHNGSHNGSHRNGSYGNGVVAPGTYTLDDYGSVLYRRRWLILLMIVVAVGASLLVSKRLTPQYEASSVFYVPMDVGAEGVRARLPSGIQDHAKAYSEILRQPDTWAKVHEKNPEKPLDEYGSDVDIVASREGIIRVYVRDENPDVVTTVANGFVDFFNHYNRDIVQTGLNRDLQLLDAELADLNDRIKTQLGAYREYLELNRIASVDTKQQELERERMLFDQQLRGSQVELLTLDQQIRSLKEQLVAEGQAVQEGEILLSNPVIVSLQEKIAQMEIEMAGISSDTRPEHPDRVMLENRYNTAKENLDKETARLVQSKSQANGTLYETMRQQLTLLEVDRSATKTKVDTLENVVTDLDREIVTVPAMRTDTSEFETVLGDLRSQRARLQLTRNDLVARGLQQKDLALSIQDARKAKKVFPLLPLNALIAGLCALVVGILYAFLIEHLETRRRFRRMRRLELEEWARSLTLRQPVNGNSALYEAMRKPVAKDPIHL